MITTRKYNLRSITILLLTVLTISANATELAVGDSVPSFSAKDQFGKGFKFGPGLHFLLLGFDMSVGKKATTQLTALDPGWLERHSAAYVLDIHTMPTIGRVFALPKMKKYPERIILVDDDKTLADFPREDGRVTVLVLSIAGKIREIRYWDPANTNITALVN